MAKYAGKFAPKRSAKAKPKAKVNKKPAIAIIAVVLAVAAIFGGTFAWQSISQQALNEITGVVNPGGRLHDDFNEVTEPGDQVKSYNKDVYVENFTTLATDGVQVFARVRLDEYMEFGPGAGQLNDEGKKSDQNHAVSLVDGAQLDNKSTWRPYVYGETDNPFVEYWTWNFGGSTIYMPTFNKNKDSLVADINGTSEDGFATYVNYSDPENRSKEKIAIYDADEDENDQLAVNGWKVNDIINGTAVNFTAENFGVKTEEETHTVRKTINGGIVSMEEYLKGFEADPTWDGTGDFWVYDTDGWAYWANPIDPDTATGLLLTDITRTQTIINEDWYYGINVVAQFITADDLGQPEYDEDGNEIKKGTGFYDLTDSEAGPTDNALLLLNKIGVDVEFELKPTEEGGMIAQADLQKALSYGGTIKLNGNVQIDAPLTVTKDTVLKLGEHTIQPAAGEVIFNQNAGNWSLLSVRGADTTLTIESGNFVAAENDSYCVDVRDGARLVINGGTFNGNISAVYVHAGEAVINDGEFLIQQNAGGNVAYNYVLNCYDANYTAGSAKIMVCGGTFYDFDPSALVEIGGYGYVADGYTVTESENGNTTVYEVAPK